jgi:transposase
VLAEMARAEVRDLAAATPEIQALERQLAKRVRAATPSLMDLYGCGDVADISRFTSEAAFASYAGLAPIPDW